MNVSYTWLRDFVDVTTSATSLRDLITSRSATVDEVIRLRTDLKDILIGKVVECEKHPDSDHLSVTKVDIGTGELLTVVCGAPNVVAGTMYPFAPVGATLPGGLKIERRKIRGVESNGMLCSAHELGLGGDHTGIMALDVFVYPGTPFLEAVQTGDTRFVIDVGANRADMLSHEGVAREVAAALYRPMRDPLAAWIEQPEQTTKPTSLLAEETTADGPVPPKISLRVDAINDCEKYCAVTIRGLQVGPSPDWLRERLEGAGVRSINNVVDATNYMLHGFGQPMHAFDANKLAGNAIVVRRAHAGEKIRTLDGIERALTDEMLVIADAERAQAIAGIIGGGDSEIDESTTDIVLEVALFEPRSVRRTRRALGISTDASYRFERAMDIERLESFAHRAAALIVTLAGGKVTDVSTVQSVLSPRRPIITLRLSRIERLLGQWVTADECNRLLRAIGFETGERVVHDRDGNTHEIIEVVPPSWRADVTAEVDLIEEVARLRGYDTFPDTLQPFRVGTSSDAPAYVTAQRITEALVSAGLYEVRPIPFVADAGEDGVRIRNPLAENESMLRSSMLSTLARRVEHNFAHMARDIRLFEVGVVFMRGEGHLPAERTCAGVVITGNRSPRHFTDPKPAHVDIWDAKWIAELISETAFGRGRVTLEPREDGRGWYAVLDGKTIGTAGELTLDAPIWASPVYGIEIDITDAFGVTPAPPRYAALPATPASEFDLALLVPEAVTAAQVEQSIRGAAGDLLEALIPFDEFRGAGIPDGIRSVAWRLTLRHSERTLREKEIEGRRDKILRTLDQELGVRPRVS